MANACKVYEPLTYDATTRDSTWVVAMDEEIEVMHLNITRDIVDILIYNNVFQ